jgi:hypothetical protein
VLRSRPAGPAALRVVLGLDRWTRSITASRSISLTTQTCSDDPKFLPPTPQRVLAPHQKLVKVLDEP